MKKPFFAITLCLLLVGCGSMFQPKDDPTRFFILSPLPQGDAHEDAIHCRGLVFGIGRVELPSYLNTQKIVTFNSTDEVVISEFNRWAEPLDQGFARVLGYNIQQVTGVTQVEMFPWVNASTNDLEVFTDVNAFEAMPDGRVELSVTWRITTGRAECLMASGTDTFYARSDGSYPSIVSAMSDALGQYSEKVAQALAQAAKVKLAFELECAEKAKKSEEAKKTEGLEEGTSPAMPQEHADDKCGGCPDLVQQ